MGVIYKSTLFIFLGILISQTDCFSQKFDLVIFSADLMPFTLSLNGKRINKIPQEIVLAEILGQYETKLKVTMPDGQIIKALLSTKASVTLKLKSIKGRYSLTPLLKEEGKNQTPIINLTLLDP